MTTIIADDNTLACQHLYTVCYMLGTYSLCLFVYFWLSYFFILYFKCQLSFQLHLSGL